MAEGKKEETSGASWWGNLLTAAKQQTENLLETVSNDLAEFTTTMQTDTKKVVDKTKESLQTKPDESGDLTATDKMRQGFHCLMDGITKALYVDPDDGPAPKSSVSEPSHAPFDRSQARLRAIQVDTGTYLNEPSGPPHMYADWLKSFDIETYKGQISDLLVSMVEVRSLYTTLVPSEISHQEFWRHYFYKVHQLKADEARKQALMKRAERVETKEDSFDWDADDSDEENDSPAKSSPKSSPDASERLKAEPSIQASAEKKTQSEKKDAEVEKRLVPEMSSPSATSEAQSGDGTQSKKVEVSDENKQKDSNCDTTDESGADTQLPEGNKTEVVPAKVDSESGVKGTDVGTGSVKNDSKPEAQSKAVESESTENCDKVNETVKEAEEIKTKVKGDMVVVGDQASSSSDSSCNKDSATDDWEEDFADVDVTQEDLEAATKLAQKLDLSAKDYSKLVGDDVDGEDDWENWS